jgi:hypothetical protein
LGRPSSTTQRGLRKNKMKLYNVRWTQTYRGWPEPELDLTLAREVLARIMAK